jgi:hypothetical protein
MRKIGVLFLLAVFASSFVLAQTEKSLTQAEFVKQLYAIQNNQARREALIETIRKRGIDFELTSGLRGLVLSKGGSGDELRRTLEEAARRKANPTAAALPGAKEADEVLAKAKEATLAAADEMPDFVVKQLVSRSYGYAGTGGWKPSDKLTYAVSYSATKGEDYKLLAINGTPQIQDKSEYSNTDVGGTTSAGEFVTVLKTVFNNDSKTDFQTVDTDMLRGRRVIVYSYDVKRENSKQTIASHGLVMQSTISGIRGKIWIDRENFRVLRIESIATEIPRDFPITAASRNVDYDWVTISDQKYLLPVLSEVRLISRYDKESIESRNLIAFRNYQKYGTEVKVLDEDEIVDETPQPKKPQ